MYNTRREGGRDSGTTENLQEWKKVDRTVNCWVLHLQKLLFIIRHIQGLFYPEPLIPSACLGALRTSEISQTPAFPYRYLRRETQPADHYLSPIAREQAWHTTSFQLHT